jgi:formylmethanofuran dehydrogenase subunit E
MKTFDDVINFHGHACPGLALGYRVSRYALSKLGKRALDEEIVAIVENDSCAIDAVQVMTGCTFGKGNLIFNDFGKQVYTFIKRKTGRGIRISIQWQPPEETGAEKTMWKRYMAGERSQDVLSAVHARKTKKIYSILKAKDRELFKVVQGKMPLPKEAHIFQSLTCTRCGEKMMESRARVKDGRIVCIPCFERN